MPDDGRVGEPGIGAAQFRGDLGVQPGQALDMGLVDARVMPRGARQPVRAPVEGRVDDQGFRHRAGIVLVAGIEDNTSSVPKSLVIDPTFDWGPDRPPCTPWHHTGIYEAHVKGLTWLHPEVPPELRGTYAGLAHPAVVRHLQSLGVTAIELLPIHHFIDEHALIVRGLSNYWGYNSIGYFAPMARYAAGEG